MSSCNGCRILRKGCSETCMLRPCLQWIQCPQAQAHATLFVAKFFGRASLMTFISSVPQLQRPALFRSLFYEACGRTVNPVHGAVGLLWTGNWSVCQAAVETVLRGEAPRPMSSEELLVAECNNDEDVTEEAESLPLSSLKRKINNFDNYYSISSLRPSPTKIIKKLKSDSPPSMNSDESITTMIRFRSLSHQQDSHSHSSEEVKLRNLFM